MPYWLCTSHEIHNVIEDEVGTGNTCTTGTYLTRLTINGVSHRLCIVEEDICTNWVEANSYIVANDFPSPAEGAELYAWGFTAVLAPVIILAIAVAIAKAIRSATRAD